MLGSLDLLDLPNHSGVTYQFLGGISIPKCKHRLLVSRIQVSVHITDTSLGIRAKWLYKRPLNLVKVSARLRESEDNFIADNGEFLIVFPSGTENLTSVNFRGG